MEKENLIDKYYKEAVKGLDEYILSEPNLWYNYTLKLPVHLQVVYTIGILHQQVFNGGFHQYFFNAYGQFVFLTLDCLKLVKAYKTRSILGRALDKVNEEQDNVEEFRKKVFYRRIKKIVNFDDELSEFLNDLDTEYDNLDEDLESLVTNYLEQF